MNRNGNETESFAGNFVAADNYGLFFEVPMRESSSIESWMETYGPIVAGLPTKVEN
jgi:hypothetical protein